jgi:hypothetical protein
MKATEIRIGNLVYGINRRNEIHLPDFHPCKVLQIELFNTEILPIEQNPATVEKWFKITNGDLSPIPLTEEWLLKFGFKKGNSIYPEGYSINILNTDTYLRPSFEGGFYWGFNLRNKSDCELYNAKPIKYVHQLQNLYFALTGNELEIK